MKSVSIGVDGGQSQVRLRVVGSSEAVQVTGVAHLEGDTVQLLADAVAAAWAQCAGPGDSVRRIALGLTTMPADAPTRDRLIAALHAATGAREVCIAGDAVTAHAGAFPDHTGIVLAVGTGVACLAVEASTGAWRRVDGDGFLLGDGGASFWIGRRGLAAVLAASDGRGPETSLAPAAIARFGAPIELAANVHALDRPVDAVAQFAAEVQRHAAEGDAVSAGIVTDAARELAVTVYAAAAVVTATPVALAITGRAAAPGTPLRLALEREIVLRGGVALVEAAGSPLDGACGFAESGVPEAYRHMTYEWSAP